MSQIALAEAGETISKAATTSREPSAQSLAPNPANRGCRRRASRSGGILVNIFKDASLSRQPLCRGTVIGLGSPWISLTRRGVNLAGRSLISYIHSHQTELLRNLAGISNVQKGSNMKESDLLVAALENDGVDRIYAVPAEGNLDFVESLPPSSLELIVTRHH